MKRNLYVGALFLALLAALLVASNILQKKAAVEAASVQAPRFEVDPLWPKPLPNHWILGQTIGVSVDAQDHVWIIHRAGSLEAGEVHATTNPPTAKCCAPAPPVLEFDQAGKSDFGWGGKGQGYDWPDSNHGITIDYKGNVWIGGNGRGRPGARGRGQRPNEGQVRCGSSGLPFNDNMVLKFTKAGKFLMQIGKPGKSKGSNDLENLRLPAKIFVDPQTNELYRRRRLRQPSRDRVRRRDRQIQTPLGRLRQDAGRRESGSVQAGCSARAAVPQSGALRGDFSGPPAVCLRPRQRSHPGVQDRTGLLSRKRSSRSNAGLGLGLGHRVFERRCSRSTSTWPMAKTIRCTSWIAQSLAGADQLRRRRPAAGRILRRAQHRDRFQGQHLYDRNLSRPARAEVRLQRLGQSPRKTRA